MEKACREGRNRIKGTGNLLMKRLFALCFILAFGSMAWGEDQSTSPYATAADFAKYAMKLRELALLKVEPQVFVPTSSRPAPTRFAWKTNIVTTVFWIGEQAGGNNPVPNYKSSWDLNWTQNYGGFDTPDPSSRRNYIPVGFIPKLNPFYCALPYNDVSHGQFKPEAPLVIPWFKQHLLFAVGRLRAIPDRPFPIRLPKRAAETKFEPRRRSRCLAGGTRLSGTCAHRCDRLAVCRCARCAAGAVAQLWREQQLRYRAAAARKPGGPAKFRGEKVSGAAI